MDSDHFPIQISLDKPLKRNTPLKELHYQFDKTDDDLLHNTLKDSLNNIDTNITRQEELEEIAVTLFDKLMKAVDSSTPKSYSCNDPKSPIGQAILDFIRVIEKRLRKHLEDNGFFSTYQSGIRKSKSTNNHLFHLSQTIMESFNWDEHVIVAFLDVKKAFDNVWHNGLRYKIYQLDLPTKLCRWLSDFLVGRVIPVKTEVFLSSNVYPKADVLQGSNLSSLLFLIYVNNMPNPSHHQTNKSQFADDASQWALSKNIDLAAKYLQWDLDKLTRWCAKWRIKLNPEKTKVIIFSKVPICNKGRTCFIFVQ